MAGLWFEELTVGRVIDAEWSRTVTEADNVQFCAMTMNVQKLHLDAEFARGTEFGRPLVNSVSSSFTRSRNSSGGRLAGSSPAAS